MPPQRRSPGTATATGSEANTDREMPAGSERGPDRQGTSTRRHPGAAEGGESSAAGTLAAPGGLAVLCRRSPMDREWRRGSATPTCHPAAGRPPTSPTVEGGEPPTGGGAGEPTGAIRAATTTRATSGSTMASCGERRATAVVPAHQRRGLRRWLGCTAAGRRPRSVQPPEDVELGRPSAIRLPRHAGLPRVDCPWKVGTPA